MQSEKNKSTWKNSADMLAMRRIALRFVLSLVFLGALVAANGLVSEERIAATKFISDVMTNIGQQRVLAQRIALLTGSMIDSPYIPARAVFRKEIVQLAATMEKYHEDLVRGGLAKKLPDNSLKKIQSIYLEEPAALDKNVNQLISSARHLTESPNDQLSLYNPDFLFIQSLNQSDQMITALNQVAAYYQEASSKIISRTIWLGRLLLGLIFLTLVGVALSSFLPMFRRVRTKLTQLEDLNNALDRHVQDTDGVNKKLKDKEAALIEIMEDQAVQKRALQSEVTERIKAEEARKELIEKLERVNKELNDFSYVVSHDLKAPLRGIGSLATWLANDYADKLGEEAKESLGLLVDRVQRMNNLIDGLLQLAKLGRTEGEPQDVNLQILVHDVVDFINPPKAFKISVDSKMPTVYCDKTRIQQVFQNLISNAIKYMNKPNGKIDINVMDGNDVWQFSVRDNGPGIDKKHHEKIFQIFQTLAPRDSSDSTGIGLSIVKKIVDTYGGRVWVESEPGAGSTFAFTLPKTPARSLAHAA